jgi:hypothetical protein
MTESTYLKTESRIEIVERRMLLRSCNSEQGALDETWASITDTARARKGACHLSKPRRIEQFVNGN